MALFDDDVLFSENPAAGTSLVSAPSSGIGLEQPPAPVVDAQGVRGMNPAERKMDARSEFISQMSTPRKILAAFGEVGAALQGRSSPLDRQIQLERQKKASQLQEFRTHVGALNDGIKMAGKLRGEARTQFIENYAQQLDSVRPGMGDTYRSMASQPDVADYIMQNYKDFPEIMASLQVDPSGESAMKIVATSDFQKRARALTDNKMLPTVIKKINSFKMGWQQLVPPAMLQRFNEDGTITASELREANEWVKANKPEFKAIALTDEDWQLIDRNQESVYGSTGIVGPKDEQELLKKRAEKAGQAPKTRTIRQGGLEIQQEWDGKQWVEVGRGAKFKPGASDATLINDRNTELKLADDYARDSKGFEGVKSAFTSATDYVAGKKYTSSGDRALAFAFIKMNDPNDRVARGDLTDIEKLGGIPERIIQGVKSLAAGQELPPRVRNEMYTEIKRRFRDMNEEQRRREKDYTRRAESYRLNVGNVVRPLAVELPDSPTPGGDQKGATKSITRAFQSAEEVREAFRAGRIDRARAKTELKKFGFE